MTVDTMRKIDRNVGMAICFLVTPLVWIIDALQSKKKNNVRRTLFIELSEMGSAIIADPAMRKLKSERNAELFFLIFSKNHKSLELLNTIPSRNIFRMRSDNLFLLLADTIKFFFWCRKNKVTMVIDLELFSRFTALLSLLSGAPERVGFTSLHDEGLYRGNIVNRPVRYNPHVHVAVNFLSLVNKAMGLFETAYATFPVATENLKLHRAEINGSSVASVKNKIRGLYPGWDDEAIVLLNVNASDLLPQRRWPPENFAAVGRYLLAHFPNTIIVLTGAPGEKEYVQRVADMVDNERCVNSAGVFRFDELVPLYSISTLMLTNDSGPAHFAATTPLKVFVLFGPETPALYLPLGGNAEPFYLALPCSPCVSAANHRKTGCEARPCIVGIPPSLVIGRLERYLLENHYLESTLTA